MNFVLAGALTDNNAGANNITADDAEHQRQQRGDVHRDDGDEPRPDDGGDVDHGLGRRFDLEEFDGDGSVGPGRRWAAACCWTTSWTATGQTVNFVLAGALTDNNAGANNITATTLNISGNNAVTSIETTVTNLDLTTAATSIDGPGRRI